MPPPIPCTTRKVIRLPTDQAVPHKAEPIMKTVSANSHMVRGMTIAIDSRYAVLTH